MRFVILRTRSLGPVLVIGLLVNSLQGGERSADKSKDKQPHFAPPTSTSWASFRNDPSQQGVAGCTLPEKLELIWELKTNDGVTATAAIVGAQAYVPELSGMLRCIELKTGNVVWSYRSIDDPDPNTFAAGFKSAATVSADTVYVGDEEGTLHAIERSTGKKKWTFKTGGEITGGVMLLDDRILFGSHDGTLYCLNAADRREIWKFPTEAPVFSSPALGGGFTFLAGCDENLRVIDVQTGRQEAALPVSAYIAASPAVFGDVLYVGTAAGEVIAYDWKEKRVAWRFRDPMRNFPYHASAAVTDEYVVVGGRDKLLHCIDRKSGEEKWHFPTRSRIDSSPVIVGDRVFFGSADRYLYGVSLKDGKQVWKYDARGDVTAGVAVGEGYLVAGAEGSGGRVFCFGAKSE